VQQIQNTQIGILISYKRNRCWALISFITRWEPSMETSQMLWTSITDQQQYYSETLRRYATAGKHEAHLSLTCSMTGKVQKWKKRAGRGWLREPSMESVIKTRSTIVVKTDTIIHQIYRRLQSRTATVKVTNAYVYRLNSTAVCNASLLPGCKAWETSSWINLPQTVTANK
jgi:hypothetical protein